MKLKRVGNEPILTPRKNVPWEKDAVLNAAAIHAEGKFHLFYRAVAHNPGDPNRSCIGHAWSTDGVHFERADEPILRPGECPEETQGVEDPRITKLGDTYHLVYTSYNLKQIQISRATSKDLVHWMRHGIMFGCDQMGNNKNGGLFPEKIDGRYALIHRPMDRGEPHEMWLSMSDDLVTWKHHRRLLRARRGEVDWEYTKIGIGAPPHKTDSGWLMVYHAVDRKFVYRLGLVLLDLKDPTKVLKRTNEPILEPAADWEVKGDVGNVVFTCGTILLGNELWVYYGGADTVIGLAKGDVREFLKG
jgi:predicted GH43/DUF377 family glycosyl hydrolase